MAAGSGVALNRAEGLTELALCFVSLPAEVPEWIELVPGGARFIREVWLAQGTSVFGTGAAWNVEFSPDGRYLYVGDGANFRIWILDRESMEILGATTVHDEYEVEANRPIHFSLTHRFAVEPNGDMLLACVNRGLRRLKFIGVS